MLGWGMARTRHEYRLIEIPVRIPGLPRALDGYVVAQVSDIHAGDFVGPKDIDAGLALVREARPDLLVVTGDIVDFDSVFAPLVARKLADVAPRDGVVASLGNHDYYSGASEVDTALRAAGIDVLVNAGKVIRPRDRGGFALLGVSDRSAWRHGGPKPDLERALAMVPQDLPRVLLSHQPQTIDKWAGRVALQLSGHTHGGQINPGNAFLGPFIEYIAGEYSVNGTTLYVNRGLGTVGPPARVGVPPEVTRIVLVAG
jgi:predicted MPP superfamily phosphohydrolase